MKPSSWLERWLVAHGVGPEEAAAAAQRARTRARRFPAPVGAAYDALEAGLDRLAPALLLRRFAAAHALDGDSFDALEHRLQHHPQVFVRLLYTLVRAPGFEQIYPDPTPAAETPHPLEAHLEANRRRTAHGRSFDAIVIGSGAGGGPVAWTLARAGYSVAIVEAGDLVQPASFGEAIERHYLDQGLVGSVAGGGATLIVAGSAVGGTTVVNSGTSLRPLPERLAAWDAACGTQFASELDPWFEQAERRVGVTVLDKRLLDGSAGVVERGFAALGRDGVHVLPRNAPSCQGKGRCCFGCPSGAKLSTDRSFLPEALAAGAVLFHRTRAAEIREERDRVEVFVTGPEGRRLLRARHLVLAGGALGTPLLVRGSRLGSRWRQAGDHLRIHPATKVFGLMPEPLPGHGIPQGVGYRDPALPRLTFEGAHTPAGAMAPILPVAGQRHRWWMERYDRVANFGLMCRDRGAGRVRGLPGAGGGRLLVDYPLHPDDARDMGRGLLLNAEAMFAAGAERVLLPLAGKGIDPELESPDALRRWRPEDFTPQRLAAAAFHPQGTCGIGRVVDPDLRLIGSRRISVADGSVLPDSPGVNPQIAIMALALRCADRVTRDLQAR